jgi:hypothetical protein
MKSGSGNTDDLLQDKVKDREGSLLHVELNQFPLIPRTGCSILDPWGQSSIEEAVKSVQLWQEVLDLRWTSLGVRSVHELHLILLEHIKGVNTSLRLHGHLVLKPKHPGKPVDSALILLHVCYPHQLLPISIKIQSSIKLTGDFHVPIILEAHHLRHLQLMTCGLDLIKHIVLLRGHPFPIYNLSLHHGCLLAKVNGMILVRVKERAIVVIRGLLAAFIHGSFTVLIDCALLIG